jgi:hypothetical protein
MAYPIIPGGQTTPSQESDQNARLAFFLAPDTFANRPAAGTLGRLYPCIDDSVIYQDMETYWRTLQPFRRYANITAVEETAPYQEGWIYCVETKSVYQSVAKGTFNTTPPAVYHPSILTCVGTELYVWQAILGPAAPTAYVGPIESRPAAENAAGMIWIDNSTGAMSVSNGVVWFDIGGTFHGSPSKAIPIDADEVGIWDSITGLLAKVTWTNLKATLKAYFDGVYPKYTPHNGYVEVCPACAGVHKLILSNAAAIDAGSGKVQLLCANTLSVPYVSGDLVTVEGTTNYNGNVTLTSGTAADRIEFTATYQAETIPGTASIKSNMDATFQLNSTAKFIAFSWVGRASWTLGTVSIYLKAIGTQGNLTLKLYATNSVGKPTGTALYDAGTQASGSTALSWVRKTLSVAQQCYGDKGYSLVIGVENGVNVSVSGKRQKANQDSGMPPGVTCWTSTDTMGTWTAFEQDSRPACFNIVLNSDENHSPQAVFGRINGSLFTFLDGSSLTIPEAGIIIPNTGLVAASTQYNIYGYNVTGTLTLDVVADTWNKSSGVKVKTGTTDHLLIGSIFGITRIGTNIAPIESEKTNSTFNENNKQEKTILIQPYGADTSEDLTAYWPTYRKASSNSDDYTALLITGPNTVLHTFLKIGNAASPTTFAIAGIDSIIPSDITKALVTIVPDASLHVSGDYIYKATEGIHSIYLLARSLSLMYYFKASAGPWFISWEHKITYKG